MFSPVDAFFLLSYTGMVYVLSCRGVSCYYRKTGMAYALSCIGFLDVIVHSDGVCSIL